MELHEAVRTGDIDRLIQLLDLGIDVNIGDKYGTPALYYATTSKQEAAMLLLIEHGADVNYQDPEFTVTILMVAAAYGMNQGVRALLDRRVNVDVTTDWNQTALTFAAQRGHREVATMLLEAGAAMRVYEAALLGDHEKIRELVAAGADIEDQVDGRTPLEAAAWQHDEETALLLRQLGAKIHNLREAAVVGDADLIRKLVQEGQDVNEADTSGATGLMIAAMAGRLDAIRALLECGADLHQTSDEGYTALKWAEVRKQSEAATLLRRYTKLR